jgi:hypothetical protein
MEKFDELLKTLNNLKITQKHMDWGENIPLDIWNEHFQEYKPLAYGLDVDTHRWYETSISVISIYGRIMGIRHISNLFSESSEVEDCYVTMEFFEMEEIQVTSYKQLNK